jgi:periplasmic protein TonB
MDTNRFFLPAWGISLALHGVVAGLALGFVAQIKPIESEDLFTWDVALVQEASPEPASKQIQSQPLLEQASARVVPQSSPRRVMTEVSQMHRPLEQKMERVQPSSEPVRPVEQKREILQVHEEPVEQRRVEVAEPTIEPVFDLKESEPVAVATLPEPVEAQFVQHEAVADPLVPTPSPEVPLVQEAPVHASSPTSGVDALPLQMVKASASDHRWLAESLWRRVAELKRYPNSARMNGQEGKVILKAIIRSDGQLADVSVQKSSGYSVLDAAAIETVKLACPLLMKHAIGKPHIVVSLPIVYSLAN